MANPDPTCKKFWGFFSLSLLPGNSALKCSVIWQELQFSHTVHFYILKLWSLLLLPTAYCRCAWSILLLSHRRMPSSLLTNQFNTWVTWIVKQRPDPAPTDISGCLYVDFRGTPMLRVLLLTVKVSECQTSLLEIHHAEECLSVSIVKWLLGFQSYCSVISTFLAAIPRHPSLSQATMGNSWFLYTKAWTMFFSLKNHNSSAWRKKCFILYYITVSKQ